MTVSVQFHRSGELLHIIRAPFPVSDDPNPISNQLQVVPKNPGDTNLATQLTILVKGSDTDLPNSSLEELTFGCVNLTPGAILNGTATTLRM